MVRANGARSPAGALGNRAVTDVAEAPLAVQRIGGDGGYAERMTPASIARVREVRVPNLRTKTACE